MGVKVLAPPPVYQPRTIADLILYAATHPTRDLIGGGFGAGLLLTQRLSPRLLDALLLLAGFRLQQRRSEPEPADAPNNVFGPTSQFDTVEGEFGKFAFKRSLYNWIETHPTVTRIAAMGAAATIVGRLAARARD